MFGFLDDGRALLLHEYYNQIYVSINCVSMLYGQDLDGFSFGRILIDPLDRILDTFNHPNPDPKRTILSTCTANNTETRAWAQKDYFVNYIACKNKIKKKMLM